MPLVLQYAVPGLFIAIGAMAKNALFWHLQAKYRVLAFFLPRLKNLFAAYFS